MRPTQPLRALAGFTAIILAFVAGCSSDPLRNSEASNAPTSRSQIEQPTVANGGIDVYTSTELGSAEWYEELKLVKEIGFDSVVAYGAMNGGTLERSKLGLDEAQKLGIDVVFSTKDILGTKDMDEDNAERHRNMLGKSTDAQVTTMINELLGHPAVKRVLIADEQPGGPEDLKEWLPALEKRYGQISKIKPVSVVLYWTPNSPDFYKAVSQYADNIQIDYYPLPQNDVYGPISAISNIGETLWQTAGSNGTFVLQAFGWDPALHPEGVELGFTRKSRAPTTAQMVAMAKLAVEGNGNGGAMSLAFYILGEPGSASTTSMRDAVRQIRDADWWKSRGN